MRLLQVAARDGAIRLGIDDGERVLVLTAAHQEITTALDLFVAIDAQRLEGPKWVRSAEAAYAASLPVRASRMDSPAAEQ